MKRTGVAPSSLPVRNRTGVPRKHLERQPGDHTPSPNRNGAENTERIEQLVAYMRQHLDQPLQISTLTTLAKVSPSYLFALFKRMTGHPPIDYFIHLRMQRACEFLEGTSLCVKEVAAALGYDDQFYFSRVFKSVQGVAPREFRLRLADPARMNGTEPLTGPEKATSEVSLLPLPAGQPASPNGWRVEDSP